MKVLLFSLCISIFQCIQVSATGYVPTPVLEKQCGVNKCRPREKCIDTVKEECTEATCTKFPTCVPVQARECDATFCPYHQVCLNVAPDCQPGGNCEPFKRCVSRISEEIIEDQCTHHVCSNGYKCIETVTPTCEDATCTKYPVCVKQEAIACTATTCHGQEVCVNVQEECQDRPCPVSKKCVPPVAKLRKCGADSCRAGEDCYELAASDCRVYNCPRYPTCLRPKDLPCNKVDCGPGSLCVNIHTECPYTACDIYARCIAKGTPTPIYEEVSCSATKCQQGQKCIDTVSPQCTDSACTRFPSCVPRVARPCTVKECRPGQVCVNVQEECTNQPCPVSKKCVPYTETGGRCGSNNCRSNEVCIGGFECDDRGCQSVDVCLPRNAASCDGVRCIRGTSCAMIKDPYCNGPGCYPVPQCLFNKQEKEGQCPAVRPGLGGACITECSSDADCSHDLKCCSNACGYVCVKPEWGEVQLPHKEEKEGQCPNVRPGLGGACITECSSDADCLDDLKCCSNACGFVCVKPEWGQIQQARCPEPDCPSECTFKRSPSDPCGTCYCSASSGHQGVQCGENVCSQGEACYTMATGNCDYSGCKQQSTCLKQQELPCNTVNCKPGTTCVNVRTDCPYTACDIYARCVPNEQNHASGVYAPTTEVTCGATTCDAGLKCIEAVTTECIDATCTKFPLCVPEVARPCSSNECNSNQVCLNVQEKCSNQPCSVSKKCVPYQACASSNCGFNEKCISAVLCDDRGCQDIQACIPKNAPTCEGARCRRNTECFMVKESNCRGPRCYPIPQCLFTGPGGSTKQCGDYACSANEQCETVHQCPEPGCQGYKTCLANNVPTCKDITCRNCKMVQLKHCFAPPCPPDPYCEDGEGDGSNKGKCGDVTCNANEQCELVYYCREPGCQGYHTCLPKNVRTCADAVCKNCRMVQLRHCVVQPCHPEPYCDDDGSNKGKCGDVTCNTNEQCELVYHCREPGCQGYHTCLPKNVRTCADAVCKNCRMVQLRHCVVQPCHPEPYCDDAPGCATKHCNRNEACIQALECSSSGCTKVAACIPLGASANTCANTKCNRHTECSMVTDPQCRHGACYPVPQCLPKTNKVVESSPDASNGRCPELPYNPLAKSCVDDHNCPTGHKCCLMKGGSTSTCTPATYEGEKPGYCPSHFPHQQSCEDQYQSLSCNGDGDCPLNYKCCPNGCTNICTAPLSGRGR